MKFTAPGVPDIYQGNEIWDFSLVDPDNRRQVDFGARAELLDRVKEFVDGAMVSDERVEHRQRIIAQCLKDLDSGSAKLLVTSMALACRHAFDGIFTSGRYIPLEVKGIQQQHVIAFARERQDNWCITVVPRLVAILLNLDDLAKLAKTEVLNELSSASTWGDTTISLPPELNSRQLTNLFSAETFGNIDGSLKLFDVFKRFPVAIITATR